MLKHILIFFLLILFVACAYSQQRWLSGYVRDSSTHFPVAGAMLSNPADRKKVQADRNGYFRIRVAPNDLLYITANAFHYDTLRYSILYGDTLTIYLVPTGNMLANVTVESKYNQYQLDSMERRTTFQKMRGQAYNAVSRPSSGFGIALNLDRLTKKKYRNKKKEERLFEATEQANYIHYRFSPQLVAFYTGLKGDALRDFLNRFTPDYQWLRQHTSNDELIYYINDKLKEYKNSISLHK